MYTIHPSAIQLLVPLYNSSDRYYHNLNHIYYGFSKFAEYKNNNEISHDIDAVISYSWWFHDAVYSPYPYYEKSSNERESSKLFDSWLYENPSVPLYNKTKLHNLSAEISTNIRATEFHLKDFKDFKYKSTPILLDMDMAGFGRSFELVYNDSDKIFKEYAELGLSKNIMLKNRIEFLTNLLKKTNIFYTKYFYEKYEHIARNNIESVIEASTQNLI